MCPTLLQLLGTVVKANANISLAANTNLNKLEKQYIKFKPKNIFLISSLENKKINKNRKYLITKDSFLKLKIGRLKVSGSPPIILIKMIIEEPLPNFSDVISSASNIETIEPVINEQIIFTNMAWMTLNLAYFDKGKLPRAQAIKIPTISIKIE